MLFIVVRINIGLLSVIKNIFTFVNLKVAGLAFKVPVLIVFILNMCVLHDITESIVILVILYYLSCYII